MSMQIALKPYDFVAGIEAAGDLWILCKEEHTLRCAVSTHRKGWWLRAIAFGGFSQSILCETEEQVFLTAEAWKVQALAEGWMNP